MGFLTQLSTPSDLNSSKMSSLAHPQGVWPFYVGICDQTQISLVSALFLCRTYSYCLHESSIRYLRYLVRKRTLHSHAKYTYRTFNSHPGTYTFDQHSHCLEQICQLCGATTGSPWQLCPVWAYHLVWWQTSGDCVHPSQRWTWVTRVREHVLHGDSHHAIIHAS